MCTHTCQKYIFVAPPSLRECHRRWFPQQSEASWPCWHKIPLQQSPAKANSMWQLRAAGCLHHPSTQPQLLTGSTFPRWEGNTRISFGVWHSPALENSWNFAERLFLRCGQLEEAFGGVWLVCVLCDFSVCFQVPVMLPPFSCVCLLVIPKGMVELFLGTPMALWVPFVHLSSSLKIEVLQKAALPHLRWCYWKVLASRTCDNLIQKGM